MSFICLSYISHISHISHISYEGSPQQNEGSLEMGPVCPGLEIPPGPGLDLRPDGRPLAQLRPRHRGGGGAVLLCLGGLSQRVRAGGEAAGVPGPGGLAASLSVPGPGGASQHYLPSAEQRQPVQVRLCKVREHSHYHYHYHHHYHCHYHPLHHHQAQAHHGHRGRLHPPGNGGTDCGLGGLSLIIIIKCNHVKKVLKRHIHTHTSLFSTKITLLN